MTGNENRPGEEWTDSDRRSSNDFDGNDANVDRSTSRQNQSSGNESGFVDHRPDGGDDVDRPGQNTKHTGQDADHTGHDADRTGDTATDDHTDAVTESDGASDGPTDEQSAEQSVECRSTDNGFEQSSDDASETNQTRTKSGLDIGKFDDVVLDRERQSRTLRRPPLGRTDLRAQRSPSTVLYASRTPAPDRTDQPDGDDSGLRAPGRDAVEHPHLREDGDRKDGECEVRQPRTRIHVTEVRRPL